MPHPKYSIGASDFLLFHWNWKPPKHWKLWFTK